MSEKRAARRSLSRRITFQVIGLMVLMAVAVNTITYLALRDTYINLSNEKAQELVRTLAGEMEPDFLEDYARTLTTEGDRDSLYTPYLLRSYYASLQNSFNSAKINFEDVKYLYVFTPYEDHFIYLLEGHRPDDDPEEASVLGDRFDYGDTEYNYLLPDIQAKRPSQQVVFGQDAGYGKTISAWAPVLSEEGNVVAVVEADYVLSDLNAVVARQALPIMGTMILSMAVIVALLVFFLRRGVTKPMNKLISLVDNFEHGQMPEETFRHDDEIQWLADSFREMTIRMDNYTKELTAVTAEKERIGAELNVATQIQADMLPRIFPPFPDREEFDLYAVMDPAKEVGGDFYDYFLIDDDHLALVMADVSGKGVPAALFMVIAKTLLKNRAQAGGGPDEILRDVNDQLCEGNEADMFATCWLGILTLSTGHLITANAGHENLAVYRKGAGFELIKDRHGLPLAAMEGSRYRTHELDLGHGDALFIYTDGVPEATNGANELFGMERAVEALNKVGEKTPREIIVSIREDVDAFVGDAPQFDDMTMLCLRFY